MKIYAIVSYWRGYADYDKYFLHRHKAQEYLKKSYIEDKEKYKLQIVSVNGKKYKLEKNSYFINYGIETNTENGFDYDEYVISKIIVELEVEE